jgi:hypothetical protein
MTQTLSKQVHSVCQTFRHETAELGEVGATFLVLWLIVVVAALAGLTLAWVL